MKIFSNNKNKAVLPEIQLLQQYFIDLERLLGAAEYVSRKQYNFLTTKYAEIASFFTSLKQTKVLNSFCRKHKYQVVNVEKFLDSVHNLQEVFDRHNNNYINKSLVSEKEYLDNILVDIDEKILLDDDQRRAILCDEDYCLVIAGAGAGKTTTVAAKVKYLVEKKNIDPKEILVISFTNQATNELKDRINKSLNINCPITTFHSTGNAILRKQSDGVVNIAGEWTLYKTINEYLKSKFINEQVIDKLLRFFGSYFKAPYTGNDLKTFFNSLAVADNTTMRSIIGDFEKQILDVREKKRITITNEIVNSREEVETANFLYLNGIDYEYEAKYPYHIYLSRKPYTPDFKITQGDKVVYLEHFGITQSGKHTYYSEDVINRYKVAIADKIEIHRKHGTKLIYTFSKYDDGSSIIDNLKKLLLESGIQLHKRDSREVYNQIANSEASKYISMFVKLMVQFINNFKTNGYTEETFFNMIRGNHNERTKLFLEIARECYLQYQRALLEDNAIDFQDMINDATRAIRLYGTMNDQLAFKYIIVDEYQDISRQRFDLTKELADATGAKIIAVGDDWQSIYAFSGSDVSLFTEFCKRMGYGRELKIVNTYRNSQEVIDIAGGFVQKNSTQIKKQLIANKHVVDPVIIYSYDDSPKKYEKGNSVNAGPRNMQALAVEEALDHIVANNKNDKLKILLIGRYGFDGERLGNTSKFQYIEVGNKIKSMKYPKLTIQFMTAHGSKGLGFDEVVVVNTANGIYGFPSQIEDDPVLDLVTHVDKAVDFAEERRLFYVAMTRTKNRVYMVTPKNNPSAFILELIEDYKNIVVEGKLSPTEKQLISGKICPICGYPLKYRKNNPFGINLYICTNEPEVCNFMSNNLSGGTMTVQKCTKCEDGYLIVKLNDKKEPILGCTNYKVDKSGCGNIINSLEYQNFSKEIVGDIYYDNDTRAENSDASGVLIEACSENTACDTADAEQVVDCNELKKHENIPDLGNYKFTIADKKYMLYIYERIIKHHPNVIFQDRNEIISICEEDRASICYFIYRDEKVQVKFKTSKRTSLDMPIELLDKYIDDVLGISVLILDENIKIKEHSTLHNTVSHKHDSAKESNVVTSGDNTGNKNNEAETHIQSGARELTKRIGRYNLICDEQGNILTDIKLLSLLRLFRRDISNIKKVAVYQVFSDKVLIRLATYKPKTLYEMVKINGCGVAKVDEYGDSIISIIQHHLLTI